MATSNRIDLSGNVFGKLKVIEYAYTKGKRAFWECLCDCGNLTAIASNSLRMGKSTTCGCSRELDLVGHIYGKLTVLEFSHVDNQKKHWKCKCSCGNIVVKKTGMLRSGNVKSCGCMRGGYGKKSFDKNKPLHFYWVLILGEGVSFQKVGLTHNIRERFVSLKSSYRKINKEECEIIPIEITSGSVNKMWDRELATKRLLRPLTYIPSENFAGRTECFNIN